MSLVVVIFARGGSKGLPGKNLMEVGGVPLIGRSVSLAKSLKDVSRVVCSTDSQEIASVAASFGAEIPFMRPPELASDTSPELEAWKHAASFLLEDGHTRSDLFLSLPTTGPLRERVDVERVVSLAGTLKWDLVVTYSEASHNPWFNMIRTEPTGEVKIVNRSAGGLITHRQKAPRVYNLVPIAYATNFGYVLDTPDLFHGRVTGVEVPRERAVDIDTMLDLEICRFLLGQTTK